MNCQNCNERLPLSAKSCFACGAPVVGTAPGVSPSAPGDVAGPARITTPTASLPAQVRVSSGSTPLLDRPFNAARRVMMLETGQRLRVHSGQMGYYGVETPDGRRGFVDQNAVKDADEAAAPSPGPPRPRFYEERMVSWPGPTGRPAPAAEIVETPVEPTPIRTPQMDMPISDPPAKSELPFNIPMIDAERVRYRAVFLYNPEEDQELVITNRRLVVTGGTIGRLPRVLHLDEVESVRLQDSGTGSTSGEGHLWITVTGVPGALHIGGVHMPHHVRNEILAAATEARTIPRTEAPTVVIRKRKSG